MPVLWLDQILRTFIGSFRIGGMILSMPVFGTSPVPSSVKFFFAIALSAAMTPFQNHLPSEIWGRPEVLFLIGARELFFGLIMGFGMRMIFLLVTMALEFCGLQMGFSIANVLDPQNNSQISVLAQLGATVTVIFFFAANLHHETFIALVRSYQILPMGLPDFDMAIQMDRLFKFLAHAVELALKLSMPIMVVMLILHLILGVISKAAPQMNLFFNVAFFINVVSGILLTMLLMPRIFGEMRMYAHAMANKGYGLW